MHLKIKRKKKKILRDPSRVITRLHIPDGAHRIQKIIQRIIDLPDTTAENLLTQIMLDFSERHKDIRRIFERRLNELKDYVHPDAALSDTNVSSGPILPWSAPLNLLPFLTLQSSYTRTRAV